MKVSLLRQNSIAPRMEVGKPTYTIYSPRNFTIKPKGTIYVYTGVRIDMEDSQVGALLFSNEELMRLKNLHIPLPVTVVDSFADEIIVELKNDSDMPRILREKEPIAELMFIQYGMFVDDDGNFLKTIDESED